MKEAVKSFHEFVRAERDLYADDDNNKVAFSFSQVGRYLSFLAVAAERHKVLSDEVAARIRQQIEYLQKRKGTRQFTAKETREMQKDAERQQLLHYEIESFFMFAKILLDKIAQFVGDYFGPARSTSLKSHNKWCKQSVVFTTNKNISLTDDMLEIMNFLNDHIVRYRDNQVTHLQNPRAGHYTVVMANGSTQIGISHLYPTGSDSFSASPEIPQTVDKIKAYLSLVLRMVEQNRSRSRYRLRTSPTIPQ